MLLGSGVLSVFRICSLLLLVVLFLVFGRRLWGGLSLFLVFGLLVFAFSCHLPRPVLFNLSSPKNKNLYFWFLDQLRVARLPVDTKKKGKTTKHRKQRKPLKGSLKRQASAASLRLVVALSAKRSRGLRFCFKCRAGMGGFFHLMQRAPQLLLAAQDCRHTVIVRRRVQLSA